MSYVINAMIPFRDRRTDWRRAANLRKVQRHYTNILPQEAMITDDRRTDQQQFNRSAAINNGVIYGRDYWRSMYPDIEMVHVVIEADMLIGWRQILEACEAAYKTPGLVVPFTEYRYLSEHHSDAVRDGFMTPASLAPESKMSHGRSIGAVNVFSDETYNLIGQYDDQFEGNWYDDDAMKIAFERAAGPTQWVEGPAYHLYHLPGWKGDHLTDEDRAATARNKARLELYKAARTPERIRELTAGAQA